MANAEEKYQVINLNNDPKQFWAFTVNIGEKNIDLQLKLFWNEMAGYWSMSLFNSSGVSLVEGIPLFCNIDLLGQFGYLEIGSAYLINLTGDPANAASNNNLNKDYFLCWMERE